MKRKHKIALLTILLFIITLVCSLVAIESFKAVYVDKRYRIYYGVKIYGDNVAYYKVFHDGDKTKMVIVMKNGDVITKDLPLDVGIHEAMYGALFAVGIISLIALVFFDYIIIDSIHYEIERMYDP